MCLPIITGLVAPAVFASTQGGEPVSLHVTFPSNTSLLNLSSPIDGKYTLNVTYGPADGPYSDTTFPVENLTSRWNEETHSLSLNFSNTPGLGVNLSVRLNWNLNDPWLPVAEANHSGGVIYSPQVPSALFNYPMPIIQSRTLQVNSSGIGEVELSQSGNYSYVNVPPSGQALWVRFQGEHFGSFPELVAVSYWLRSDNSSAPSVSFPCETKPDPELVNGPAGSVTESSVVCRTHTDEPTGVYNFQLNAAGQLATGVDTLVFPNAPSVTQVTGCGNSTGEGGRGTFQCPTLGGVRLTLFGSDFLEDLEVSVGGKECTDLVWDGEADGTLSCVLPAGTGVLVSLVVSLTVSEEGEDDVIISSPLYADLVGYAPPHVTSISHSGCTPGSSALVQLENCPRHGTGTLTITGTNLGADPAVVLVGSGVCSNIVYSDPSVQVQCELPAGVGVATGVIYIQAGGALSLGEVSLSYEQCSPGLFQDGLELECVSCEAGKVTETEGQSSCVSCPAGSLNNSLNDGCMDCEPGRVSQAGAAQCDACGIGTYASGSGSIVCSLCEAGKSQHESGMTGCQDCEFGKSNNAFGRQACDDCEPGSFTSNSTSLYTCTLCAVGKYQSEGNATSCETCPAGSHQSATGQSNCTLCETGRYSPDTGRSACIDCPPGEFVGSTGSALCVECSPGTFKPDTGVDRCSNCSEGSYTDVATNKVSCVLCAPGSFQAHEGMDRCEACPAGFYSALSGIGECQECLAGTSSVTGSSTCADCGR